MQTLLLFWVLFTWFQTAWASPPTLQKDLLITARQLQILPPEKTVIVDTRSKWKYFISHIPGAVNPADWQDFTRTRNGVRGLLIADPAIMAAKFRPLGIDTQKTLVIYGDPRDPWRTDGRFFWMFQSLGFPSVKILEGGFEFWKQSGGSIERGKGNPVNPSALSAADIRLNAGVVADKNWIRERMASGKIAIIDNRTQKEYDGETPYGSSRGGHIPNAIHIHWPDFFTREGIIKDPRVLTSMLEDYGIRPDQEVVVYCTGGVRSAMAFFVLKYLGYTVRNYDGSWWDWSSDPAFPVEHS